VAPRRGHRASRAVAIELGDETTHEQARDALSLALRWRDGLRRFQGPWFHGNDWDFVQDLDTRQKAGESYRQLAKKLNDSIARCIELWQENDDPRPDEDLLWVPDPMHHGHTWLHRAESTLRVFLSPEESHRYLKTVYSNLGAGKPAFDTDLPITGEMVREKIRGYRNREGQGP